MQDRTIISTLRAPLIALSLIITVPALAQVSSTGTGFRIAPGTFVTNQHVIDDCTSLKVNGVAKASVVASDKVNDLALVHLPGDKGEIASVRTSRARLNEAVTVAGFPLEGLFSGITVTSGSISRLSGLGGDTAMLQISAPVQPGNSGGPLLDTSGNVIGVVSSKLDALKATAVTGDVPQNVNFAISVNVLRNFLDAKSTDYTEVGTESALQPTEIAEEATKFTVLIECIGAIQPRKAVIIGEKALLRLDLVGFTYEFAEGRHRYNHRRLFTEIAGTGVTVTRGKVCVMNGEECADALVNYRIEALQTLEQKNHYIATPLEKDRITLHYWAEDDKGNKLAIDKVIVTDGQNAVVE